MATNKKLAAFFQERLDCPLYTPSAKMIIRLALVEGFTAHAMSIVVRVEDPTCIGVRGVKAEVGASGCNECHVD